MAACQDSGLYSCRLTGSSAAKHYFDGRTASELRLPFALDADLLVPCHYIASGMTSI